ncbi:MAG TPA: hypothetical protein VLF41_03330 [Candidatus Nanoarchaeia archaeon]|nr:hypothetical protein [Candidatus Nanoarchaeia archaeon]
MNPDANNPQHSPESTTPAIPAPGSITSPAVPVADPLTSTALSPAAPPVAPAPVLIPVPVSNTTQPPAKRQTDKKTGRNVLVVLIVLAVAALVGYYFLIAAITGEQSKVTLQFIGDIQRNKADEAWSLTSAEFQKAATKEQFSAFVADESQTLPKPPASITSRSIGPKNGQTQTTIIASVKDSSGGDSFNVTTVLVKQAGHWLILKFDVE